MIVPTYPIKEYLFLQTYIDQALLTIFDYLPMVFRWEVERNFLRFSWSITEQFEEKIKKSVPCVAPRLSLIGNCPSVCLLQYYQDNNRNKLLLTAFIEMVQVIDLNSKCLPSYGLVGKVIIIHKATRFVLFKDLI